MITIVIVNYNNANQVKDYIDRIQRFSIINHILIVDNASPDGSYESLINLKSDKIEIVSSGKNGGYGYGNNFGIRYAKEKYNSDFALISNADVYYDEGLVESMVSLMRQENLSVVSGLMKNPDGSITYPWKIPSGWQYVLNACVGLNRFTKGFSYSAFELNNSNQEWAFVDCVPGSFLMVNIDDFFEIAGYDESIFLYCEEMILGIRLREKNKRSAVLTNQFFIHNHPKSKNQIIKEQHLMWKSRKEVLKKYYFFTPFQIRIVSFLAKVSVAIIKRRVNEH